MSSLKLFQLQNGYRYNSDTLYLYDFLTKYLKKGSILDIGCGCGVLGLLIKRDFLQMDVDMVDFQKENIDLSQKNALENSLNVNIFKSDFLDINHGEKYDFLVSNPPFYHENVKKSQNLHLAKSRYSNFLPFEDFAKKCYKILKQKGKFCFCYDAKQITSVFSLLLKSGFGVEFVRFVYPKPTKDASLVLVLAKKDFKGMSKILPPLISSDESGYTKESQRVFSKANTVSFSW